MTNLQSLTVLVALLMITMWTPILCDDPIEFLVSQSTPKDKKLHIPELDDLTKSRLDVYIEVDDPEEYVPCGDGALEEETDYENHKEAGSGTIYLKISHPMLENGKEFINVTVNGTKKLETRPLCFNESLADVTPKLLSVFATSDLTHDMNVKIEVKLIQNSKCSPLPSVKDLKESGSSIALIVIILLVIFVSLAIFLIVVLVYLKGSKRMCYHQVVAVRVSGGISRKTFSWC